MVALSGNIPSAAQRADSPGTWIPLGEFARPAYFAHRRFPRAMPDTDNLDEYQTSIVDLFEWLVAMTALVTENVSNHDQSLISLQESHAATNEHLVRLEETLERLFERLIAMTATVADNVAHHDAYIESIDNSLEKIEQALRRLRK